jgi:hypothetical protein
MPYYAILCIKIVNPKYWMHGENLDLWSPLLGFRSAFEACLASGAKSELMYLSIAGFCRNDARCWMLLHMTEEYGGYVCNKHIH